MVSNKTEAAMNCNNHLRIEGSKKDIKKFVSQGKRLFLFGFIPFPFEYSFVERYRRPKEMDKLLRLKYGSDNLNKWCLANWGTEDDEAGLFYDNKIHSFSFTTNHPPVIAVIRVSLLYPRLKILYEYKMDKKDTDKMLGRWGKYIIKNGQIEYEKYEKPVIHKLVMWRKVIDGRDKKMEALRERKSYGDY